MERKLPIQKCMGKITVRLKLHGESEIVRNQVKYHVSQVK